MSAAYCLAAPSHPVGVAAGRLRFVLWRGPGRAEVVGDVSEGAVRAAL